MTLDNLPHFLRKCAGADLVVEFADGDRYPIAALELVGDEDWCGLSVSFEACLGLARSYVRAIQQGDRNPLEGSSWQSGRPIGMVYQLEQVRLIEENGAGRLVYEREDGPAAAAPGPSPPTG